jgi:hypothetical protein
LLGETTRRNARRRDPGRSEGADKGSEFVVRLPIVVPELASHEPISTPKPLYNLANLRALVVDDNPDAAKVLTNLVERLGNDVRTAEDGLQAIEIAADFHPRQRTQIAGFDHHLIKPIALSDLQELPDQIASKPS